jgi:hypothetical protein
MRMASSARPRASARTRSNIGSPSAAGATLSVVVSGLNGPSHLVRNLVQSLLDAEEARQRHGELVYGAFRTFLGRGGRLAETAVGGLPCGRSAHLPIEGGGDVVLEALAHGLGFPGLGFQWRTFESA